MKKRCTKCFETKLYAEFRTHKKAKDGLQSWCKNCEKAQASLYFKNRVKSGTLWRDTHKEQSTAKAREWRHRNSEKEKEVNRKRRELERQGKVTKSEWEAIKKLYGNKCLCCQKDNVKLTMDHIVPLGVGKHEPNNVQPLCLSCNCKKSKKTIDYRPFPLPILW